MADLKVIAEALTDLQAAFPNWKATENTAQVWAKYLKDFDNDVLKEAVERFIMTSETSFPPTLPDILNIAREIKSRNDSKFIPEDWRKRNV